ncbi:unnamed protein product, partial [Ectocarpus fasciculatus]
KVSSVLNGATAEFGNKNMFDGGDVTCWNSDGVRTIQRYMCAHLIFCGITQGSPQTVTIDFGRKVRLHHMDVMFQGGFVGKDPIMACGESLKELVPCETFDPADTNDIQTFQIQAQGEVGPITARYLKIEFHSSTDFYGRITIYQFKV